MHCLSDFIPWNQVSVTGDFVGHIQELIRTEVLPYQWEALNDQIAGAEPSHCLDNFRAAAEKKGHIQFHGQPFQDSDIYKWIEAAAYTLAWHPDSDLEAKADQAIELICGAQQPDGYLNTYFILTGAQRWTHLLDGHELYCAGHLMEAAVAYYHATGKDKLLKAAQKLADHIADVFGTSPGKIPGYPGHLPARSLPLNIPKGSRPIRLGLGRQPFSISVLSSRKTYSGTDRARGPCGKGFVFMLRHRRCSRPNPGCGTAGNLPPFVGGSNPNQIVYYRRCRIFCIWRSVYLCL